MAQNPSSPFRLLVEGPDDGFTIINFLMRHNYNWDDLNEIRPHVQWIGGYDKLSRVLERTPNGSYDRLGIVVDADTDMPRRWRQVQGYLSNKGITLPEQPEPRGTLVDGREFATKIGIWLMPDNKSNGALEDFVGKLVPGGDACWGYAHEVATEARKRYAGVACPEKDHMKSRLYSWLAWQREPGLPFGTALNAKIFCHDSPEALIFLDWFHRLFPSIPVER